MVLSYVDGEQGGYGVGTRQVLSTNPALSAECMASFNNFARIIAKHDPEVEFDLVNPCAKPQKGALDSVGQYALDMLVKQAPLY